MAALPRAAVIGTASLGCVALALGAAAVLLTMGDPLSALPREDPGRLAVVEESSERWRSRTLVHLTLEGARVGRARIVVSLPDPLPGARLPVVVVVGGLRGGSDSIREISELAGDLGPNAFLGYDWPLPTREPSVPEIVRRVLELRRRVLSVPGQLDTIVAWASQRPWADPDRVNLLGFSLGAFVVPASQRLVQERGGQVSATVLGYGGAPIREVIAGHPNAGPWGLRHVLGFAAGVLLRPVEPSVHLPHLRGRFLLLEADTDRLIARSAGARLTALTPEPRTVVRIPGDHLGVGPDPAALLGRVIDVSRAWLLQQHAIDAR